MADQDDPKNQVPEAASPAASESSNPSKEEPVELSTESQNLLRQFDERGLQVESMPESNELQERRRKTKNRLRELAEVENVEEEGSQTFENEEGGLMDLLREARLSPRQLGFCCGGVVLLVVLVGLVYGGIRVWNSWDFSTDENSSTEENPTEEPEVSDYADPTLQAGALVGRETEPDGSTSLGEDLGAAASSDDELTQLIADFSLLYEAMQVDVNQLLDQSPDRSQALADYEQKLNYLLYVGKQNVQRLDEEITNLEDQYEAIQDQKDTQEDRFFDRLRQVDAFASSAALESFIADGQEIVRLRAHYQAREKLASYYELVLENMSARIADIQLNERALVEGIQVVDIEGSDIDLIIDESEL